TPFQLNHGFLWNKYFRQDGEKLLIESLPLSSDSNNFLFHASSLYQWLSVIQMNRLQRSEDTYKQVKSEWIENLISIKRFSDKKNARFLLLLFPVHAREKDPEKGGKLPPPWDRWSYKWVEEFASRHGIDTLRVSSLTEEFEHRELSSDMWCHYNPKGHKVIGEKLADYLNDFLTH
ncbi:MAG: hypothetical protein AB1546_14705, partial [bacterium]